MTTFGHLRKLHDCIELLCAAAALSLPETKEHARLALLEQLCPEEMTPQIAERLATGELLARVRAYLKSLAPYARGKKPASIP